jgi:Protein of unknown function (DUF3108)
MRTPGAEGESRSPSNDLRSRSRPPLGARARARLVDGAVLSSGSRRNPFALAALVLALAAASPPRARADVWLLDDPCLRELTPADLVAHPARFPFPVGERLEYAVSWHGVPAGRAVIEIARFVARDDERYAHVVGTADTNPLFSLLYPLHDRSEAWIDLDSGVTVRTRAVELRRAKHFDESVVYDWRTHFLHARLDKLHKGERREVDFDFGPFAHDTSDVLFALRAQPLAPGFAIGLPTYADRRLFELRIDVVAGPRVETTPFGATDTLEVHPSTWIDGVQHGAGAGVVLVAGAARVPLRLDGWIQTTENPQQLSGLRAELVRYTASAPGWRPAEAPALPVAASMPPTHEGVPVWDPPVSVREARTAAGVAPRDVRSRIAASRE